MSDRKIENRKQSGPGPGGGGHMGGGMRKIEKAKNFKGTMNKLLQYLNPYKLKSNVENKIRIVYKHTYSRYT